MPSFLPWKKKGQPGTGVQDIGNMALNKGANVLGNVGANAANIKNMATSKLLEKTTAFTNKQNLRNAASSMLKSSPAMAPGMGTGAPFVPAWVTVPQLMQFSSAGTQQFAQSAPTNGPAQTSETETGTGKASSLNPGMVGQGLSSLDRGIPASGLNSAFETLYKIITIIVVLIFFMVVITTLTDLVKYFWAEARQRFKRIKEPNMYNKDTTDIDALKYISATNVEDETYSIFKEQRYISYIFLLVGIMVTLMGFHLGLFFAFKIWSIFNGRVFNENVTLPMRLILALLIVVIGAFMMKDTYKSRFIKKVQTALVDMRSQLTAIRTVIFNNLTTDNEFLQALTNDNIEEIINVIRKRLESKKGQTCNDGANPCDTDVENMIFSLNLYSYIRYQIPPSDPNFDKVKMLFQPDGVRNRTVDPILYFYYKQPIYVANLYPSIQERLIARNKDGNVPDPFNSDSDRERILMTNINTKMQTLNGLLTRLHNIATGKVNVRTYLIIVASIAFLFSFILIGIFYSELSPFIYMGKELVITLWKFLSNSFVFRALFFWARATS